MMDVMDWHWLAEKERERDDINAGMMFSFASSLAISSFFESSLSTMWASSMTFWIPENVVKTNSNGEMPPSRANISTLPSTIFGYLFERTTLTCLVTNHAKYSSRLSQAAWQFLGGFWYRLRA
jgi:hypothetical protein